METKSLSWNKETVSRMFDCNMYYTDKFYQGMLNCEHRAVKYIEETDELDFYTLSLAKEHVESFVKKNHLNPKDFSIEKQAFWALAGFYYRVIKYHHDDDMFPNTGVLLGMKI